MSRSQQAMAEALSLRIDRTILRQGVVCRPLAEDDLPHIVALATRCLQEDGGLPLIASADFLKERFWQSSPRHSIGLFAPDHAMLAYGVLIRPTSSQKRLTAHMLIDPTYRPYPLATLLADWIEEAALHLCPADGSPTESATLCVVDETLTEAAIQFYRSRNFVQTFAERIHRFALDKALPLAVLPHGLRLARWTSDQAHTFFQAYSTSFADRPGFPNWSAEQWIDWIAGDKDFSPDYSFVVCEESTPVGFIACSEDYVTQIGVHPDWRRKGIAFALLGSSLACMQEAGFSEAWLTVNDNNPAAICAYLRFGFQQVGCRGRFEKPLRIVPGSERREL